MVVAEDQRAREPQPLFIVDSPSSQDELGAHGRLARAISQVIRDDDRVKTIGILGGWGSGKSTIVRLVQEALEDVGQSRQFHCFTYDAWLHQSDPPRRAFLEALVSYVQRKSGFDDVLASETKWRSKLDELNKQTETSETTTTPTLTKAGLWYLPTLILIPIGVKLIGDGTLAPDRQADLASMIMFIIGWIFALAPGIAALIIYLLWRPWESWRSVFRKTFWTVHKSPHEAESILSVVANKHVEKKQELKAKSPEPTAIEFQDAFREITEAAQTSARRLVIVVDNLDRLAPQEAVNIWATIRSFFLGSDGQSRRPDRSSLPTVIVPIDEKAISRIHGGAEDNNQLSRSFIEKTFDLVFHVPAPVLSRWHAYLRQRLVEVFGSRMSSDWPHIIGTVYEAWLGETRQKPAPRSINTFVNDIATTWMQLEGEPIHIGVLAYFVTKREEIASDFYRSVSTPNEMLDSFDRDWGLSIAALHYGVGIEDAQELFLDGPIRSAIQTRDREKFAELAKVPGFERYYLRVLESPMSQPPLSPTAGATLLDSLKDEGEAWRAEAWRRLRQWAVSLTDENSITSSDAKGFAALIGSCDDASRPRFLRALAQQLKDLTAKAVDSTGAPFAEIALLLIQQAHEDGLEDFQVIVPGGPDSFLRVLQHIGRPDISRALHPADGRVDKVVTSLAQDMRDDWGASQAPRAAAALAARGPSDLDWSAVLDVAAEFFQSNDSTKVALAAAVVKALCADVPLTHERLRQWRDQSFMQHAFNTAWQQGDDSSLANVTALTISCEGGLASPDGRSWEARLATSLEVPRLVDEALREISDEVDLARLAKRLNSYPSEAPLLQAIASQRFDRDPEGQPDNATLLSSPEQYTALMPVELRPKFWSHVSTREGFWALLQTLPIERAAPVFCAIIDSEIGKAPLGKALQKQFELVEKHQWDSAVRGGAEPIGLVRALDRLARTSVTVGVNAQSQLFDLIPELLATHDGGLRQRWFAIAARLSTANRKTLLKTLRGRLANGAQVTDLRALLEIAGPGLLSDGEFARHGDLSVLHLVFPLVGSPDGRNWLINNVEEISTWVEGADHSTVISLLDQLKPLADAGEPQAAELVVALRLAELTSSRS